MIDSGELMYNNQQDFNIRLFKNKLKDFTSLKNEEITAELKEFILNFIREATEALNTRKFKMHRNENKEEINSNTIEELIDCQKYLWGAMQLLGIDWKTFIEEYWRKTNVVEQRFYQEHQLSKDIVGKKIIALDLDGVLCKYPQPWIDFVNFQLISTFKSIDEIKNNVTPAAYAKLKSNYRQSGYKKFIPAVSYASEFTQILRNLGYFIIILTSRPYKTYTRIYPDTLEWLSNNKITYDALYFDENKNIKISEELQNLHYMVEDNLEYANSVAKLGYKVYYLGESAANMHANVIKVDRLLDILLKEGLPLGQLDFDPIHD